MSVNSALRRAMRPAGRFRPYYFRLLRGRRSRRDVRRLQYGWDGDGARCVQVDVRPLRAPVEIRPGTSDMDVFYNVFVDGYHRPPSDVRADATLIWDLGANIGLTMADMAVRFPRARIVGVELDPGNAAQARSVTSPWADRTEVVQAAVWPHDGDVEFGGVEGDEQGIHVIDGGGAGDRAPALSLDTLLGRCGHPERIDYVKMDIEGAEREVLRGGGEWPGRVAVIQVERHYDYTRDELAADLSALGFDPRDGVRADSVIGIRTGVPHSAVLDRSPLT
jgi:FkbM family methyltransferase